MFELDIDEAEEKRLCRHSCSGLCRELGFTNAAGTPPPGGPPWSTAESAAQSCSAAGDAGSSAGSATANTTTTAAKLAGALRDAFDRAGLQLGEEAAPLLFLDEGADLSGWLGGGGEGTGEALELQELEDFFRSSASGDGSSFEVLDLDLGGLGLDALFDLGDRSAIGVQQHGRYGKGRHRKSRRQKHNRQGVMTSDVGGHSQSTKSGAVGTSSNVAGPGESELLRSSAVPPPRLPLSLGPLSAGGGNRATSSGLPQLQPLRQGLLKGLPEAARWARGRPPFLERLRERALSRLGPVFSSSAKAVLGSGGPP